MWLQARNVVQTETNNSDAEYVDAALDYEFQEIRLQIYFGGLELGTDNPGLFDYFQPFHEIVDAGIREVSISFEVSEYGYLDTLNSYTLTLFPEEHSVLSVHLEGRSWYHFKIKEWYFVKNK